MQEMVFSRLPPIVREFGRERGGTVGVIAIVVSGAASRPTEPGRNSRR
jgi:hypothetical protein